MNSTTRRAEPAVSGQRGSERQGKVDWTSFIPAALKDSFILIGLVSILLGLLIRRAGGNYRGLGLAVALVGVILLVAPPVGRLAGWW